MCYCQCILSTQHPIIPLNKHEGWAFEARTCPHLFTQQGNESERKVRPAGAPSPFSGHHAILTRTLPLTGLVGGLSGAGHAGQLLLVLTQALSHCIATGHLLGVRIHSAHLRSQLNTSPSYFEGLHNQEERRLCRC